MGFMTPIKANKAYRMQQKGQKAEALKLYEEAFSEGLNDPRYVLSYALLLIRDGEYQKAKDFLVKHQKAPGMTQEQRITLFVDYAACCFRLGDIDKGINTLEQQFRKTETGLIYQTLGYLYVEKYDAAGRPAFEKQPVPAEEPACVTEEELTEQPAETTEDGQTGESALSPREAWDAGVKKAEEFIRKSIEYDDADAICLDNMGQFLYRVMEDRAGAKPWFEKAIAIKDKQIRFSPLNYCGREKILKEIERLKGAD